MAESLTVVGDGEKQGFFISHAGPDAEWAEWIGQQLEGAGYSVELDVWEWSAGTDFVAAMQNALDRAGGMIAVWTPTYFGRMWTGVEVRAAFAHSQTVANWLVPVVVESCDDQIPIMYRTVLRIDLVGLPEQEARTRLLTELESPARPDGPVAFPGSRPGTPTVQMMVFPGLRPPVWGAVPAQNLFFTGRDDLLGKLHNRLATGTGRVAIAARQASGGVGKTQLATEYAWRHAADYQLVWWVDANSPTTMVAGLAKLAGELGLADTGDVPTRAGKALAELGRREDWLLVYDDVTDPATLARLLPPTTGHLIVTARDSGVQRVGVEVMEVGVFSRPESLTLLRRHVPDMTDEDAGRLAEALEDLPLALNLAGAFLAATGMHPDSYLDLIFDRGQTELAGGTPHPPGLAATITIAYTRLAAEQPSAATLLNQLAFLGSEPIPLTAAPTGDGTPVAGSLVIAEPAATTTTVAAISRLGLACQSGTTVQVHRLVHILLRSRLDPRQAAAALTSALNLLATAYPGDPDEPANWPAYAALAPHLTAVAGHLGAGGGVAEPDGFRRLLGDGCRYLHSTGQLHAARTLAEQARVRWTAALGGDHRDSRLITAALAATLTDLGEPDAARELTEDTSARHRRPGGPDHPDAPTATGRDHRHTPEPHSDQLARRGTGRRRRDRAGIAVLTSLLVLVAAVAAVVVFTSSGSSFDVEAAVNRTDSAPYAATVEMESFEGNRLMATMNGRINLNGPRTGNLRIRSGPDTPAAQSIDKEIVVTEEGSYTRDRGGGGVPTGWIRVSPLESYTVDYGTYARLLLELGPQAQKGVEQLGGVPVYRLSGALGVEQIRIVDPHLYNNLRSLGVEEFNCDAWVNEDGRVVRFEQWVTIDSQPGHNVVTLSDFGPPFKVMPPTTG